MLSLRAKLLLGIVLANLLAFAVLALSVLRDVDARAGELARSEREFREKFVRLAQELIGKVFDGIDFGAIDPSVIQQVLALEKLPYVRDAYVTNAPYRISDRVRPGRVDLNPLGAPDAESERMRSGALDLMEQAIAAREPLIDGDVTVLPLYGKLENGARTTWGAAYLRVDVPRPPAPPAGMSVALVALAIGGATIVAIALLYLLLNFLVLRPLSRVTGAAERLSQGRSDAAVVNTGSGDEIDALITSFNSMSTEVGQAREALERRVEQALERMRATEQRLVLNERLAAMGTLAAGIAHEINNPLGGMMNAVATIQRKGEPGELSRKYLALVESGLTRIRDVVARVLRFSPAHRERGRVRLDQVVDDATRFVAHRLAGLKIALTTRLEPGLEVAGDAAALGQVLLNLLLNAIDAMDGRAGSIAISARRDAESVVLEVEDDGRGMPKDVAARAFDLFFTTKSTGTGIGLSIAHLIVTEHGGSIAVESEPGRGTRFTIRLPAGRAPGGPA